MSSSSSSSPESSSSSSISAAKEKKEEKATQDKTQQQQQEEKKEEEKEEKKEVKKKNESKEKDTAKPEKKEGTSAKKEKKSNEKKSDKKESKNGKERKEKEEGGKEEEKVKEEVITEVPPKSSSSSSSSEKEKAVTNGKDKSKGKESDQGKGKEKANGEREKEKGKEKGKEKEKEKALSPEELEAAIQKNRNILRESQELDLVNLEVVVVEDSDDKSEQNISKSDEEEKASDNSSSDKTNHFDGCPDEIVFKIFDFLDEKEMAKSAQVCHRFYDLQFDPSAWENKVPTWVNIRAQRSQRDQKNNALNVRDFYIYKYQEHLKIEANRLANEKQARIAARHEAEVENVDRVLKYGFFNRGAAEWLWLVCFTLYSVLLALRLDDIIICNWHYIHIPVYVAFSYSMLGVILWRFFYKFYDTYITWSYGKRVMSGNSFMQLYTDFHDFIFYGLTLWTLAAFIAFFALLAEAKNDQSGLFETWPAMVAMLAGCFGYGIAFIQGFGQGAIWKSDNWWRWFLFLPLLYYIWVWIFIWLKSEAIVLFNWYAAFSPLWIVLISGFFGVFFGLGYAWFDSFGSERIIIGFIWAGAMAAISGIISFLGLIAYNLEQEIYNLEMFPWVIVFTPLFIVEFLGFIACGGFDIWYVFFK